MIVEKKNLVLIGDTTIGFGVACSSQLIDSGLEVIRVEKDIARVIETVLTSRPNVIVMDTFYQNDELILLIDQVRTIDNYSPKFIIVESNQSPTSSCTLLLDKIDLFVKFPVNIVALCDDILTIINRTVEKLTPKNQVITPVVDLTDIQDDLEVAVTDVILLIGIPAHVKGYQYIRCAILNCIENPNMLNSVTKVLYPTVAKEFNTSSSRVERAIRHAIEIAWDRGDVETINNYFGHTVSSHRGKPTNSEFIAMLSDKLRLKNKHILAKKNASNS